MEFYFLGSVKEAAHFEITGNEEGMADDVVPGVLTPFLQNKLICRTEGWVA